MNRKIKALIVISGPCVCLIVGLSSSSKKPSIESNHITIMESQQDPVRSLDHETKIPSPVIDDSEQEHANLLDGFFLAMESEQWREYEGELLKMRDLSADNDILLLALGQIAQFKRFDLELARTYYEAALQANANNSIVLDALLGIYKQSQQLDAGIEFLESIRDKSSVPGPIHQALAKALSQSNRPDEAVQYFERELPAAKSTQDSSYFESSAGTYLDLGQFDRALEQYQLAMDLTDDQGKKQDLSFKMAKAHVLKNDLDQAESILKNAFGEKHAAELRRTLDF